ncbi:MAG: mechanosensitive ion channel, partial [Ruminococcus sp.]|nr:mechanosensitive ion channel [Ruminococcus sp.]
TTVDNKRIVIPNSHLTKNQIVNFSAEDNRRVDLIYSIGYNDDIEKAKSVILEVAHTNQLVLDDPDAVVYVKSHSASSIDLLTRIWCKSENYWDVYYAMQEEVKLAFDRNGINIPYTQLDVHIVDKH